MQNKIMFLVFGFALVFGILFYFATKKDSCKPIKITYITPLDTIEVIIKNDSVFSTFIQGHRMTNGKYLLSDKISLRDLNSGGFGDRRFKIHYEPIIEDE